MTNYIMKRCLRAPGSPLVVLLFAVILSVSLCGLQALNEQEERHYQQVRDTLPITLTVTNLTGVRSTNLDIPRWAVNVFEDDYSIVDSLKPFVKDSRCRTHLEAAGVAVNGEVLQDITVVGLTDFRADPQFQSDADTPVTWFSGYEASALRTDALICVVPEAWVSDGAAPKEIVITFRHTEPFPEPPVTKTRELTLLVVGTHRANSSQVFLPYRVVCDTYSIIGKALSVDSISAVLKKNSYLEQARETSKTWFVEPNLKGEKTVWGAYGNMYYPFALKIDDSQITSAAETMENSIRTNQICTVLVFVLAMGAGFFIGFLMIRNRRREIALMRTLGNSGIGIYGGFILEQMLCVALGIAIGGAFFLWHPAERLLLFGGIYFVSLTVALLIFLNSNLLSAIKEDE